MHFGSKYVYTRGTARDSRVDSEEEVKIREDDNAVLSCSSDESDDEETCILDIFDTAGQEEYSVLREQYVRTGDGFVVVFSVTDVVSLQEAESMFQWLKRFQDDFQAVLCGNKTDLTAERVVTQEDGRGLADKLGVPYFETSAKTGEGVDDLFQGLMKTIPRTGENYKLVMLGTGGVGKSSVTLRFTQDNFLEDYDPTIEDSFRKMIKVTGQPKGDRKAREAKKKKALKALKSTGKGGAKPKRRKQRAHMDADPFGRAAVQMATLNVCQQSSAVPGMAQQQMAASASDDDDDDSGSEAEEAKPVKTRKTRQRKIDGNVVLVSLGELAKDPNLVTGDPVRCAGCEAILSSTSILTPEEGGSKAWTCEFCGHNNKGLDVEEEEVPQGECFDFMLAPAPSTEEEQEAGASTAEKKVKPGYTIYCMDTSGSMDSTCEMPEFQAAWRLDRTRGQSSVGQVSRLQCIKEAVEKQLEQMHVEQPDKPVMLATFGSDLYVKGGGDFTDPQTAQTSGAFRNLDCEQYEDLLDKGKELARNYQLKPLADSFAGLDAAVKGLNTSGCTALGPALALCSGFVSEVPGSEIILCTDGMPNEGVGSLHETNESSFYRQIGEYARSNQTVISILAVEGEPVGLNRVQVAAEVSGGSINVLNPLEMVRQLRQIMQNSLVATMVSIIFFLHPDFVFNEPGYPDDASRLSKELGNVLKEDNLTFRFQPRDPSKELSMDQVPFQIQITYTRRDGMKCLRVLSKSTQATANRAEMEEEINVSVLGAAAIKTTAALAKINDVTSANSHLKAVKRLARRGAKTCDQKEELHAFRDQCQDLDSELLDNMADWNGASASHSDVRTNMLMAQTKMAHHHLLGARSKATKARFMSMKSKEQYYLHKF